MQTQDKLSLIAITLCWLAVLLTLSPITALSAESDLTDINSPALVINEQPAAKQQSAPPSASQQTQEATALPEVKVNAVKIKDVTIDPTQSITTITAKDLEHTQPATVFDAIRDVPGVSVSGGPRPSGMTFNVRGYTDNEDVAVKVDGVPKGFEKYRMGGTFIEPELLKSIEVQRGPQITSGSGSLGGTIIATTKDASDLLKPGQKYGARSKFGYANNNDEYSRSYMVYGRPHERIDILYNYSNRQSNNITLADGSKLETSAIESISKLLKVSLFPTDSIRLTTSIVSFDDTGLQPFDATGSGPGSFGFVIRSIDDLTWSETLHFTPEDNKWIDLKAIYGRGHTDLEDLIPPQTNSGSPNLQNNPLCNGPLLNGNANNLVCRGNLLDTYNYKTETIDLSNRSRIYEGDYFKSSVLVGYQFNESERDVTRVSENARYNAFFNPNGFNASVPPGTKTTHAIYLQPRFQLGALSITPGVRWDKLEVEATGGSEKILQQNNEATKVEMDQRTYSLGLAYDLIPRRLTLFSNYGQGFRPPLLDEYFTQGGFGRCAAFNMPSGPKSGICGDLYKPQLSESTEAGISYQNPRLLDTAAQLTSKFTYFHISTSNLLSSLGETSTGEIVQRGKESRNGIEFENTISYRMLYGRMAYSRTAGSTDTDIRVRNSAIPFPSQLLYNQQTRYPLYTVPGNALSLTLGADVTKSLNVNINYRKVSSRTVVLSGDLSEGTLAFGKQDGYELFNASAHYRVNEYLGFRLIGENLANKQYNLDGGFGGSIGLPAPGRNLRFVAELTY